MTIRHLRLSFMCCAALLCVQLSAQAQCQDQLCYFNASTGCYTCQQNPGLFCSLKIARCNKTCTTGVCNGAALARLQGAKTAATKLLLLNCAESSVKAASLKAVAQVTSVPNNGTGMRIVQQVDSPLALIEATHGIEDLLEHAVVENVGKDKIVSYKIGWIVWYHDSAKSPDIGAGREMRPEGGIEPGVVVGVASQNVPGTYLKKGARLVAFFVAEATTENGIVFKANTDEIVRDTQ